MYYTNVTIEEQSEFYTYFMTVLNGGEPFVPGTTVVNANYIYRGAVDRDENRGAVDLALVPAANDEVTTIFTDYSMGRIYKESIAAYLFDRHSGSWRKCFLRDGGARRPAGHSGYSGRTLSRRNGAIGPTHSERGYHQSTVVWDWLCIGSGGAHCHLKAGSRTDGPVPLGDQGAFSWQTIGRDGWSGSWR